MDKVEYRRYLSHFELVKGPVHLGDFGLSFREGYPPPNSVQGPVAFCAPERLHGAVSSRASDMWSYMTLFAALYLGFDAIGRECIDAISWVVGMLGPFPGQWKASFASNSPCLH
jgi:serine/threonine protein kinase